MLTIVYRDIPARLHNRRGLKNLANVSIYSYKDYGNHKGTVRIYVIAMYRLSGNELWYCLGGEVYTE